MTSANGDNLVLGRGALFLDKFVNGARTGGERFVGNVSELTLTTTDELRERYSSSEAASPLLKRVVSRRTVEIVATMDEFTTQNLELMLMGESSVATQSAAAVTDQALGGVQQGLYYDLGSRNIAAVVVTSDPSGTTYVVGDDYTVDLVKGILYIVPGGDIADDDDILVDFTRETVTNVTTVNGGKASLIEAYLRFESDNATGPNYRLKAWRVSITPDGELGFISDDFGTFNIRMAVQNDGVNHPTQPNYVLETFTTG